MSFYHFCTPPFFEDEWKIIPFVVLTMKRTGDSPTRKVTQSHRPQAQKPHSAEESDRIDSIHYFMPSISSTCVRVGVCACVYLSHLNVRFEFAEYPKWVFLFAILCTALYYFAVQYTEATTHNSHNIRNHNCQCQFLGKYVPRTIQTCFVSV